MMLLTRLAVVAVCVALAKGFGYFRDDIPNGYFVPNPCTQGTLWKGVGHLSPEGRGDRNQFGIDFARNGQLWQNVCRLDSDGDGRTNGEELGDPYCVWSKGSTPYNTSGITHPGFCDPVGGEECLNNENKTSCAGSTFDCPAIKEPGVQSRVLRFPKTSVPNQKTNYFCMTFDLDQSQDYHMIASKPEIDNKNVVHHILMYGCIDGAESITTPKSCGMSAVKCEDIIGFWIAGTSGECLYKEAGFRIGKSGFKRVLLEFHWNNPQKRSDLTDGSGMTIYYTPKLRTHDAGVFWIGETNLVIPPRRQRVVFDSTCPSECTERILKDTIYFTQGFNHMHYRGTAQRVRKLSGGVMSDLTNDQEFNFDMPKKYTYDPPVAFHPGDALMTTCVFQSMEDNKTAVFGLTTADEMCFGTFTYYPKESVLLERCISSGTYDRCKMNGPFYDDCNVANFMNRSHPETKKFMEKVVQNCNTYGGCRQECPAAIAEALRHPCLREDKREWVFRFTAGAQDILAIKFVSAMHSCSCDPERPPLTWPISGAPISAVSAYSFILAVFVSCISM